MSKIKNLVKFVTMILAFTGAGSTMAAQSADIGNYPDRAIRVIVPYAPGGGLDVVVRMVSERLAASLGQPIVVDNRSGASGLVGAGAAAQAKPDGYTLLAGSMGSSVLSPLVQKEISFHPMDSFVPISKIADSPFMLLVRPASGIETLSDLVSTLKKNAGKNAYGSAGAGSPARLLGVLLLSETGTQAQHIAYRGETPNLQDLMAGQLQFAFGTASAAAGLVQGGTLRALASTGKSRMKQLPDVPTFRELNYPKLEISTWFGLFAPAGTPAGIVNRLAKAVSEAVSDPALQERAIQIGFKLEASQPAEFRAEVKNDLERFAELLKLADVQKE